MTPFQAIMGQSAQMGGQTVQPMMNDPIGGMQNVFQRAQHLANSFRNPQQMVQQFFPDAPVEIQNDPNQLLAWMQQTGRVNPQMVQMIRQMAGVK